MEYKSLAERNEPSFFGLFRAIYRTLREILAELEITNTNMVTEKDLDDAIAELKQATSDAADRVNKKIDALIASQPDLTDELQAVKDEVTTMKGIAPDAPRDPTALGQ